MSEKRVRDAGSDSAGRNVIGFRFRSRRFVFLSPFKTGIDCGETDRDACSAIAKALDSRYGKIKYSTKALIVCYFVRDNFIYSMDRREEDEFRTIPPRRMVVTRRGVCKDFCILAACILKCWMVDVELATFACVGSDDYHMMYKVGMMYYDPTSGAVFDQYPDCYDLKELVSADRRIPYLNPLWYSRKT